MSSGPVSHPEEGILLRYLDGELPRREAQAVERHLEACWPCRSELAELQKTVADCVWYRNEVLDAHLPPPPQPWMDIYRGFERIDAGSRSGYPGTLFDRLFKTRGLRWGLAAAAAGLVALGVFYQLGETPSVQAAAILKKAVAAAESAPRPVRRVRVRTRNAQITRVVAREASPELPPPPDIQVLFAAAHYSWEDPLSAKSYEAWRAGLAGREQDEVARVPDPQSPGGSCYRIRTIPETGELASASLTLRAADLVPVEGRLEFRNREWVEMTDITEVSSGSGNAPTLNGIEAPLRPAEPSSTAAVPKGRTPDEPASISDELQVLAALHQIGADLGDPLEVTRAGGRILVTGVGIPVRRQKQIREALEGTPRVALDFPEPATAVPPEPAGQDYAGAPKAAPVPAIQSRLEERLGGRAELERFSSQMLEWNEAAMSRAYALRALAQRFPPAAERGLGAADRRLLEDLCREHAAALSRQAAAMRHALVPLLVALGGANPERRSAGRRDAWQASTEQLLAASRRAEVLLSVLLGVVPDEHPTAGVPSDLLAAMRDVESSLDECQRLLLEDAGR
jgi:anti-sigma factor RsiW